jgi:hypothetical protein
MGVIHQIANGSAALAFFVVLLLASQTFVASRSAKIDAGQIKSVTLPL